MNNFSNETDTRQTTCTPTEADKKKETDWRQYLNNEADMRQTRDGYSTG